MSGWIVNFEEQLIAQLGWPLWALRTIVVLTLMVVFTGILQNICDIDSEKSDSAGSKLTHKTWEFRFFQMQYLTVFLIIMLADWLQGTNMYTLYSSYGMNVGTLFLTGFLSSAVFGTFLGIYVDTWGRKLGCIIFCVLEIVINLMEHVPNMPTLLIGRVLGGLSTSLLFTAFESWMVSEHRKRGFAEDWLASTFSICSWGNGFIAICAGFLAQIASDVAGDIGPFQLAIALTVVSLVLILPWRENYGNSSNGSDDSSNSSDNGNDSLKSNKSNKSNNSKSSNGKKSNSNSGSAAESHSSSMIASMRSSWALIRTSPAVLYLGLSQAFFEGAVFTFVFMWVPSLLAANPGGALPTGLVFSAFMLAMTLGGMLFGLLLPVFPGGAEGLCVFVYAVAALTMAVPIIRFDFWSVLISFLVLESMLGMFSSCGATLRSRYYPEALQSSVMSVFRLPLNLLVVVGTLLTSSANGVESLQFVFGVVVCMHVVAVLLQIALLISISSDSGRSSSTVNIRGKKGGSCSGARAQAKRMVAASSSNRVKAE